MAHNRDSSLLSCSSAEFEEFFENDNLHTDVLVDDCLTYIQQHENELRAANKKYHLDEVLRGMVKWGPSDAGRRYAAVVIHVASHHGLESVVSAAQSWVDNLLLPVLTLARKSVAREPPLSVQTPTVDETALEIETANRSEQQRLRALVGFRENYYCAISGTFDADRVKVFRRLHKPIPPGGQASMQAAHILPLSLNGFDEADNGELFDAAATWDMLKQWTRIDIKALAGSDINTPKNCINMTMQDHRAFGRFEFYLSRSGPDSYTAHMLDEDRRFVNGTQTTSVTFRSKAITNIDPPDPDLIAIHAAFAKVLHLCGAAEYLDDIERQREEGTTLRLDGETDFGDILKTSLMVSSTRREGCVH
ncbi:hypothetical protein C8R47DRAFT_1094439 [Mycena vitilis]|nr:hypothetical protein C8R47DRAFT_1094439 [Mycena vitilis]